MALPKGETDKELLRLKARVAELEAELRTIKNVDEGNSNVVSTASEADDSSSSSSDDEEPVEQPTLVPETASNVFATENPIPMDGVVQYEERIEYDASDLLEEYTVLPQSLQSDIELSQVLHEQTVEEDEQGEPSTSATSIRRKKKLPCSICGKKFPFQSELKRHINTHQSMDEREAMKKLECHICSKRFHWNCDLTRHIVTHGENRPHNCTICNAAFKLPEGLKKHMVLHAEGSVKCSKCHRTYKNSVSLRSHSCSRLSNSEKKFLCETCGKGFSRKDQLNVHKRIHSGERPYNCDICSKCYITGSKLNKHHNSHRLKPYMCQGCGKLFSNSGALQKHLHLDPQTWAENISLIDIQVLTLAAGKVVVQLDPCVEYSDSEDIEMDISETNITETPCTPNQSPTQEGTTPLLTGTQTAPPENPSSSQAPPTEKSVPEQPTSDVATTPSNSVTQPTPSQESPAPGTAPTPSSSFQLSGSSVYVQLMNGGMAMDKDGNPLVQLHVQPTDDGQINLVSTNRDVVDVHSPTAQQTTPTVSAPTSIVTTPTTSIVTTPTITDTPSTCLPPTELDTSTSSAAEVSPTLDTPLSQVVKSFPPVSNIMVHLGRPRTLPNMAIVTYPNFATPPCLLCSDAFDSADSLADHMLIHMSPKPYKCNRCRTGFETSGEHDTHNCRPLSNECPQCPQAFGNYCSLIAHFTELHKAVTMTRSKPVRSSIVGISKAKALKTLTCWYCEKLFPSDNELVLHTTENHSGSHPFKCDECDKSYAKKHYLRAHTRTHTGEKQPHQCDFCDKTFSTKERLKIHTRIHTGERPYKCQVCGEGFIRKYILQVHMRLHTGEKPYKCEYCNKQYRVYTDCRIHVEDVHEGRRIVCGECGKSFKRSAYRTHMARKHKKGLEGEGSGQADEQAAENGEVEGQEGMSVDGAVGAGVGESVEGGGGGVESEEGAGAEVVGVSGVGGVVETTPPPPVVAIGGQLFSRTVQ